MLGRLARSRDLNGRKVTVRAQLEALKLKDESGNSILPPLLQEECDLLERLDAVLWVYDDYRDAVRGRKSGLDGHDRLNHEKLFYWQWNRNIRVPSWQLTAMMDMDDAYLQELVAPLEETQDG